jgi:hypothetical protein
VQSVPDVGKVTLVPAVAVNVIGNAPLVVNASAKDTLLPAVKVSVSVPPKVMTLSAKVVDPLTVRVLPAPKVNVPEPVEITLPLIVAVERELANTLGKV